MKMKKSARGAIPKGTFSKLIKYIASAYKLQIATVVICIFINTVAGVADVLFLQRIIDDCIIPGLKTGLNSVLQELTFYLTAMVCLYTLGIIASFIWSRLMANITQGTLMNFRNDMFRRMETLPVKYFDTNAHGDIMSTYTNDTDATRQLISQNLPSLLQTGLTVIFIFAMMMYYSVWLMIIVLAFTALMILITKKVGGASSKYMVSQQASLAKEEGFVEEMISGQKVIKVFNHEKQGEKDFDKLNDALFSDSRKANYYGNILAPILNNLGNILYVVLAVAGGMIIVFKGTNIGLSGMSGITLGIIVSFLGMSRQFSHNVSQAAMQLPTVTMALAGAARIFKLCDEQPEHDGGYVKLVNAVKDKDGNLSPCKKRTGVWAWEHYHKHSGSTTYTELRGDIVMEDVTFGYTEKKTVLHNISLYAHPGEKIAFVGATGAGKTTITNLINRFYDIPDGKIRYDGININKINKSDLRRSLGMVLQDVNLFTGNVMENIRYGRLDATDAECIEAAKLANAHDFISRLPDGYDTILNGNGSSLSQGQRQLISIARAAVADPPVMILDEATSSIDTRTESLVQDGMDKLMHGRTVFVIAHRLSTIRNAQAIMVLDHGKITERGTHAELLAQKGMYYQLYTGAFELE